MTSAATERMIPTPENWHWAITPEDVKKLATGDRETVNRCYLANYEKFRKVAYNFCRKEYQLMWYEDCIHEIYFAMPYLNYTNAKTFYYGLIKTFWLVITGKCRIHNALSLFAPLANGEKSKKEFTLADVLSYDLIQKSCRREEQEEGERKALQIISSQTVLSSLEKDFLTAVAFRCTPYRGLFEYEYKHVFA